jgi:hypothetical protein
MPKYTVTFEGVAVSAAQDLVSLKFAAAVPGKILRYWLTATDTSLPVSQMLQMRARVLPATVTQGSGGTVPTPQKIASQTDAAAQATAHVNDTSKATTGGTAAIVDEQGCHVYNGYDSAQQGRQPFNIAAAAGFVWELLSAPTGTVHLSGGVDFEEVD